VRDRVADFKRPKEYRFIAELPKNATGKIERARLRALGTPSR
jgi:acyl-coenzyme A synthetase/AMP-(fatty) acid ligase